MATLEEADQLRSSIELALVAFSTRTFGHELSTAAAALIAEPITQRSLAGFLDVLPDVESTDAAARNVIEQVARYLADVEPRLRAQAETDPAALERLVRASRAILGALGGEAGKGADDIAGPGLGSLLPDSSKVLWVFGGLLVVGLAFALGRR